MKPEMIQCQKCKGKGATKRAADGESFVPSSVRDLHAHICPDCRGEGFIPSAEIKAARKANARHSQIVDELVKNPKQEVQWSEPNDPEDFKPKEQSYPSWMEDGDD